MIIKYEAGSEDGYAYALAALRFFSFPGAAQVASWRMVAQQQVPWFFHEHVGDNCSFDYFFGIACTFKTYKSYLYDRYGNRQGNPNTMDFGALADFDNLMNTYMVRDAEAWSEIAVLETGDSVWEGFRKCAKRALDELGEAIPTEPPIFIFDGLIDPDEFRTSNEILQILERDF